MIRSSEYSHGETMAGPNLISIQRLSKLVGLPTAPVIIDVRIDEDWGADPRLLPASNRRDYHHIGEWQSELEKRSIIIVCHHGAKLSHGTAALLRSFGHDAISLEGGFEAWKDDGQILLPAAHVAKSALWVTRHRPKIDRIACPWLIRRFINEKAKFMFVQPDQVEAVADRFGATAFDMPTGFWTHRGDGCTFDTMVEEFNLNTPALAKMAEIIRAADTDRLETSKEAAGLLAISLGLSRQYADDREQLEAGMAVYDALYRWARDATDETHNWAPAK